MRTLLCFLGCFCYLLSGTAQSGWEQLPTAIANHTPIIYAGEALQFSDGNFIYRLPDGDSIWHRTQVDGLAPILKFWKAHDRSFLRLRCAITYPLYNPYQERVYQSYDGGATWDSWVDCGPHSPIPQVNSVITPWGSEATVIQQTSSPGGVITVNVDAQERTFEGVKLLHLNPTEVYLHDISQQLIYQFHFQDQTLDTLSVPVHTEGALSSENYFVAFSNTTSSYISYRLQSGGSWYKLFVGEPGKMWSAVGSRLFFVRDESLFLMDFSGELSVEPPTPQLVWTAPENITYFQAGEGFLLVETSQKMFLSRETTPVGIDMNFSEYSRGLPRKSFGSPNYTPYGIGPTNSYTLDGWQYKLDAHLAGRATSLIDGTDYRIQRNAPFSQLPTHILGWDGGVHYRNQMVFAYKNVVIVSGHNGYAISTNFGVTFEPLEVPWRFGFFAYNNSWYGTGYRAENHAHFFSDSIYLYARTAHNQGVHRRLLAPYLLENNAEHIGEHTKLKGRVYEDLNGNCRPDAGEPTFANVPIILKIVNPAFAHYLPTFHFDTVYTNSDGWWSNQSMLGYVTFRMEPPDGYEFACAAQTDSVYTVLPNRTNRKDFPLQELMLPPVMDAASPRRETSVFPNPFTEQLNIRSDDPNMAWTIIDPAGTVVATGNAADRRSISTDHLSPGIYLVRLSTTSEVRSFKMVKR